MHALLATFAAAVVLVTLTASERFTRLETQAPPVPDVSAILAPTGLDVDAVRWIEITADVGVMRAAIARPTGPGPFPAAVVLHGTHGFAREYVQLAQELARGGVLTMAPCWFSGRSGAGVDAITPIECPRAPALPPHLSAAARHIVDVIVGAARALPEARADRIALVGHSRGGGAALDYVLASTTPVRAIAINSSGYPGEFIDSVSRLSIPLLMLHGVADGAADGGGPMTSIGRARAFEAAASRAGKPVEAVFYDTGRHGSLFTDTAQHGDEVRRIIAFLTRQLLH